MGDNFVSEHLWFSLKTNLSIYIYIYIYAIGNHIPHFPHEQITFLWCCYIWSIRRVENIFFSPSCLADLHFLICFPPLVKQSICHNICAYSWQIPFLLGQSVNKIVWDELYVYVSWANFLRKQIKLNHHEGSFQADLLKGFPFSCHELKLYLKSKNIVLYSNVSQLWHFKIYGL